MILETKQLKLIPLSYEQVEMFRHLNDELEDSLGLPHSDREIPEHFRGALLRYTLPWIKEDPENYLFATVWVMIEAESNSIVGDIGFKRKADPSGYVEIGYSTQPRHRRKEFMTEAIGALTSWALTHDEVKAVIAETLEINDASIKALRTNGFTEFHYVKPVTGENRIPENPDVKMLWWKKTRESDETKL